MKPDHLPALAALIAGSLFNPVQSPAQVAAPAPEAPASPDAPESADLDSVGNWTRDMDCTTAAVGGAVVGAAIGARMDTFAGPILKPGIAEAAGAAVGFQQAHKMTCGDRE